jgi:lauroyl/myristoyl acyltransferase
MKIDPQKIINSPIGLNIAFRLGKSTPYSVGYRIANFVADRISARKNWKMVRAIRCNQWVAHGEDLDKSGLDELVARNLRSTAKSIFDFYHTLDNPAESLRLIDPHPVGIQLVQRPEFCSRGLVLVGVHMSNFDMAFQVGGLAGIKATIITLPEFDAGYKKQWDIRSRNGVKFERGSVGSIKKAIEHLRAGGMIITAVDRPDSTSTYFPKFFGRPAAMPVHHIFMALKAKVPIQIAAILTGANGCYRFTFSDPIEMEAHTDRHTEILLNAEKILHAAEDIIRQDPSQWSMAFPVWPELIDQVP